MREFYVTDPDGNTLHFGEPIQFRERAGRPDIEKAKRIPKRAGKGSPPVPGDEIVS